MVVSRQESRPGVDTTPLTPNSTEMDRSSPVNLNWIRKWLDPCLPFTIDTADISIYLFEKPSIGYDVAGQSRDLFSFTICGPRDDIQMCAECVFFVTFNQRL